jgi:hypothetical protein
MLALVLMALSCGSRASAHGGVVADEDQCLIEIGVFSAHFTVYQPETRASREFCEDIPDVANAVFVMDYLHNSLKEVPVDFRIIRDVIGRRTYANASDIGQISDLDAATEFYQPPQVYPQGSLSVEHRFREAGWYIGVVTTRHPTLDRTYEAVFGFHVGGKGLGFWPLIILVMLGVQVHYWVSGDGFARWKQARDTQP